MCVCVCEREREREREREKITIKEDGVTCVCVCMRERERERERERTITTISDLLSLSAELEEVLHSSPFSSLIVMRIWTTECTKHPPSTWLLHTRQPGGLTWGSHMNTPHYQNTHTHTF